ncbi:hypothetical protein LEP1GSC051_0760 [Leptospira sp. P2653]|nr:hypothetical protein LEP1GSC051_0760 [Leptospira sp. P2653]
MTKKTRTHRSPGFHKKENCFTNDPAWKEEASLQSEIETILIAKSS